MRINLGVPHRNQGIMTHTQKEAVNSLMDKLCKSINIDDVLIYLGMHPKYLLREQVTRIKKCKTDKEKRLKFLETVQTSDYGWMILQSALEYAGQKSLADLVTAQWKKLENASKHETSLV